MLEDYMGDAMVGEDNSQPCRIEGMDDYIWAKIVRAFVPLAEMFG